MFDSLPTPISSRKSLGLKLFSATAATAVAAMLAVAGTAAAGTTTKGTTGVVYLPRTGGTGGYTNLIGTGDLTVSRSAAVAGTQRITVRFTLYRWVNGVWTIYRTFVPRDQYLASGMRATFADQSLMFDDNGYYRSAWEIWWRQPSGTTFAYQRTVYDLNDYYCIGVITTNCKVGTGWIYLGT
jgi:hypothetical protein